MDKLLVESFGLNKACDAFQSYSQLQMFLLAHPDTFIIDNNMRRNRPWLRAWRVSRSRLHDRSTFTTYSRSEVDRVRQTVETWCVMVSIIDHVTHPLRHNKIFAFPQGAESPKSYEVLAQASSSLFTSLIVG